jgi:hypothetical protein
MARWLAVGADRDRAAARLAVASTDGHTPSKKLLNTLAEAQAKMADLEAKLNLVQAARNALVEAVPWIGPIDIPELPPMRNVAQ